MDLLIVDDHPLVRQGLRQALDQQRGTVVKDEARNASEALALLRARRYDVVVMDINLPDGSGLEVIRELRTFNQSLPVLVLSMHAEDSLALRAIRVGADGYVNKESSPETLLAAIHKVANGAKHFSSELLAQLVAEASGRRVVAAHDRLSDREYQVMCMLANGDAIAAIGAKLKLSPNTISTYRARIFEKLGVDSNAQLARYAIQHQLIA